MNAATTTIHQVAEVFAAASEVVKVVEQAMPQSGKGAAKLEAARMLLIAAGVITEAAAPLADKIVFILVSLYNATGMFKRS